MSMCKHKQITSYLRDSVDTSRNSIMLEVHYLSKAWHHLTPNAVHFSLTFDNGEKTKIFARSVAHLYTFYPFAIIQNIYLFMFFFWNSN